MDDFDDFDDFDDSDFVEAFYDDGDDDVDGDRSGAGF